MRWRSLAVAVAVAGMAVWLAACDFSGAFETYCTKPGRCTSLDDAGSAAVPLQIAQGTPSRHVSLTGAYLFDVTEVRVLPPGAGMASNVVSSNGGVELDLQIAHGVDAGELVYLQLVWDPDRSEEFRKADPFVVTPIVVEKRGDDSIGDGTHIRPFLTLAHASEQSGPGDTIRVGPGSYGTIYATAGAACDDLAAGLKPGVTVDGDQRDGGVVTIAGANVAGTCAFNLSSVDQAVRDLRITGFPQGIRASDAGSAIGPRARAVNVEISGCGIGVMAEAGSRLLLQDVIIQDSTDRGLVLDGGADVQVQRGAIYGAARNGVVTIGANGSLLLNMVTLINNGTTQVGNPQQGAGVLVAGTSGLVSIDGGEIRDNEGAAVSVAGRSNTVTINGPTLQATKAGQDALRLESACDASVFLANTTISNANQWGIRAQDFASFNGGMADGGWGGNLVANNQTGNILDARTTTSSPRMTFARTRFEDPSNPPPPAGLIAFPGDVGLSIQIAATGNFVEFQ